MEDFSYDFNGGSTNFFNEIEDVEEHFTESSFYKIPMNVFVLVIDVVSIFANYFVITSILRKRSSWSIVNVFIIAMAVNDFILGIIDVIFVPIHSLFQFPRLNTTLCQFDGYSIHMAAFLNAFLLAALLTVLSFFKSFRLRKALIVIATASVTAMILAVPNGYFNTVFHIDVTNEYLCYEPWSNSKMKLNIKILQHVAEGSAFILSAVICFVKFRRFRGDSAEIIRKLPFLILIEIICWLPHFSVKTLEVFDTLSVIEYQTIYVFVYFVKAAGVIIKPTFYFFFHEDLREEFLSILPSCFKKPPVAESYDLNDNENM